MGTEVDGELLTAIIEAVDDLRVATVAQVHAHLAPALREVTESVITTTAQDAAQLELVDDLVFSRASLVAGRVFTARSESIPAIENHHDLAPFLAAQRHLDNRPGVVISAPDRPAVVVVESILTSLGSAGHFLSIGAPADLATTEFGEVSPDRLHCEAVGSDRLAAGHVEIAALRTAAEHRLGSGRGASARNLVAFALALNDQCFRSATLPLTDLFAAAGLVGMDGEWGLSDDEWTTTSATVTESMIERLVAEHRLNADEGGDFRSAVAQWQQWIGGRDTINASSFSALLSGRVAGAFAEYWQPTSSGSIEDWMDQRRLAETLARDHGDHPGVNYLRGMIDLRLGDGAAALRFFEMAHEADEDYLPVRRELGLLMLDGSHFEEAMDVLPSDLEVFGAVEYLFDRARRDRERADRGDPCRCGSGKKYRSCCAKQLRLSEADQLDIIGIRLAEFLTDPPWSMQMDRLADIVSTEWGLMSFPEALADPFVQDVLAIESGGAAGYLASRRDVLTSDDAEILAGFTAQSRDAFDIVSAGPSRWQIRHPDSGVELEIDALEREPSDGDAVLVRTLVRGDRRIPAGPPVLIPEAHVSLLRVTLGSRPTAEQLLGWVCRRSEILRPSIDLSAEIDLRDHGDEALAAGIDLDDLARRAMES